MLWSTSDHFLWIFWRHWLEISASACIFHNDEILIGNNSLFSDCLQDCRVVCSRCEGHWHQRTIAPPSKISKEVKDYRLLLSPETLLFLLSPEMLLLLLSSLLLLLLSSLNRIWHFITEAASIVLVVIVTTWGWRSCWWSLPPPLSSAWAAAPPPPFLFRRLATAAKI